MVELYLSLVAIYHGPEVAGLKPNTEIVGVGAQQRVVAGSNRYVSCKGRFEESKIEDRIADKVNER